MNWYFATKVIDASKITFVQLKDITNRIQDDGGDDVLTVDFANKYIGGGVLMAGLVQEELLFLTYPELFLTKLMIPLAMQADEAVVVTSVIRTSDYTYDQNRRVVPVKLGVNEQNILGNFVAIDALNYTNKNHNNKGDIDRELHKAYVGFNQAEFTTIRTGSWGSGAFRGDNRLNKKMVYSCFENTDGPTLKGILFACLGKQNKDVYSMLLKIDSHAKLTKLFK